MCIRDRPEPTAPEEQSEEPVYQVPVENEMPLLIPRQTEPAQEEEPFVLEELTRPEPPEAEEQPQTPEENPPEPEA